MIINTVLSEGNSWSHTI